MEERIAALEAASTAMSNAEGFVIGTTIGLLAVVIINVLVFIATRPK